ncbi:MAG: hypothetical protein ABWZ78_08135, partial [Burkholderiaceae bacterium]
RRRLAALDFQRPAPGIFWLAISGATYLGLAEPDQMTPCRTRLHYRRTADGFASILVRALFGWLSRPVID